MAACRYTINLGGGVWQCPHCSDTYDTGTYPRNWNGTTAADYGPAMGRPRQHTGRAANAAANVMVVVLLLLVIVALAALTNG